MLRGGGTKRATILLYFCGSADLSFMPFSPQRALQSKKLNPDRKFSARNLQSPIEIFNLNRKFQSPSFHLRGPRSVQRRARSKISVHDRSLNVFNPEGCDRIFSIPGPSGSCEPVDPLQGSKSPKSGKEGFGAQKTPLSHRLRKGRFESKKSPFLYRAPQGKWGFSDSKRPSLGRWEMGVFGPRNPLFPILGILTPVRGRRVRNLFPDPSFSSYAAKRIFFPTLSFFFFFFSLSLSLHLQQNDPCFYLKTCIPLKGTPMKHTA